MITTALWYLLTSQVLLGGFDTFYHHEFSERLAWRSSQRRELQLHAMRNALYLVLFMTFAWIEPHGLFALALMGLLLAEALLTMIDFVEEDRSRRLPATERVTHGVITINYGAVLALLIPTLWTRASEPAALLTTSHDAWSVAATVVGLLIGLLALRDFAASRRVVRLKHPMAKRLVESLPETQRVLVTGGTGFIGSRLVEALVDGGHRVTVLTRDPQSVTHLRTPLHVVTDLAQITNDDHFDAVVNLAGEPLANGLWTRAKRRRIMDSRMRVTEGLVHLLERLKTRPSVLVSGSAIGWYGIRGDEPLNESDDGTACFSRDVCVNWEVAANRAATLGVRVVNLRIGLVLGRDGGMLAQLLTPFELGGGGPMGNGKHWMSWIERDDLIRLIVHAMVTRDLTGPLNATAPNPVVNNDFSSALGKALRRPSLLRVPAWPLKLIAGDLARELLLGGQRVLPDKARASGFEYEYPDLDAALAHILKPQGSAFNAAGRDSIDVARGT